MRYQFYNNIMRIFVTTPSVKSGSTLLAWLIKRHSWFSHTEHQLEQIELGAMLNVLDHIPEWRATHGLHGQTVGNQPMIDKITNFTDSIINPLGKDNCLVKFTNFTSYRWLSHLFPNDKIVVIVRDLYDWYGSVKVWNTTRHMSWDIHHVSACINKAANSLAGLPTIKIVQFEDLIADPHSTMKNVHLYLNLPHEPVNLEGHENIFKYFSCKPEISESIKTDELFKSPLGRSRELSDDDKKIIDKIANSINVIDMYSDTRRI